MITQEEIVKKSHFHSSSDFFLCPDCKKAIPDISLTSYKGQMYIYVQCSCLKEEKFTTLNEFMVQINKMTINKTEIDVQCIQHNKPYSLYCNQCHINICDECKRIHNAHDLIEVLKADEISIDMNTLEQLINSNQQNTEALINEIDIQINRLIKIKEDLLSVFHSTNQINSNLQQMYQLLLKTAVKLKDTPLYQLMRMNTTMKLNEVKYLEEEDQSIEERCNRLKNHLQTNFILKQDNVLNECKAKLNGHSNPINCLIQLKDGRIASGSYDQSIRLWDTTTLQWQTSLLGHNDTVECLIQLTDGQLASGSWDKVIKVWNTTTNQCKTTLIGHADYVMCLIQLADGRLASGSWDKTIKLWDIVSNQCQTTFIEHDDSVQCLIQLNDGRLASGSSDNSIKLWETSNYQSLITLKGHSHDVFCLLQLKDGRLASGSWDNSIKIWDLVTNECKLTLSGHKNNVMSLIQLSDGRLASGSLDKSIMLWDSTSKECKASLTENGNFVLCLLPIILYKLMID